MASLPVIDISPLRDPNADRRPVAEALHHACRTFGFFYIAEHGVPPDLLVRLETESRRFFAYPEQEKLRIRMSNGGLAWRGYFPVGAELTSERPDQKEGLYFGAELPPDHPRVLAKIPLHGPNLFYDDALRTVVLEYMQALTQLSHLVTEGLSMSLGLPPQALYHRYTHDPLILFRIFHYPPLPSHTPQDTWSVGEHTDYGLLTLLWQDDAGGLQIKTQDGWLDAPPIPGTFICNLGDMLERLTGGKYRSTPHRVRNQSNQGRLSFPFFFDPGFDIEVRPIDGLPVTDDGGQDRWDHRSVFAFKGTYGDYILEKVSHVFPQLKRHVIDDAKPE